MDERSAKKDERGGEREIGATAGKTHEQVLDEVVGRARDPRASEE